MEEQGNKSVFSTILGEVDNHELDQIFTGLDKIFDIITAEINTELPQELSDENLNQWLVSKADNWDKIIWNSPNGEEYVDQARKVLDLLYYYNEEKSLEEERERQNLLRPLSEWMHHLDKPHSFAQLLYYHQRLKQLHWLVGMYHLKADGFAKTNRHLFETGLSLLRIHDYDYLGIVYDYYEDYKFSSSVEFISSLNHYSPYADATPKIDWLTDKNEISTARDKLYKHLKYAELAYRKYRKKGRRIETLSLYKLHFSKYGGKIIKGRFQLPGNLNGYVGFRDQDKAIVVCFSGTELFSWKNWKTNFCQYFGKLDPVYLQAAGLLHAVWMGKTHKKGFKDSKIIVCGHSLGGGLMQYATSLMQKPDIFGYGYNSAGLSKENLFNVFCWKPLNILQLHMRFDVIFKLPFTLQLGKSVNCKMMLTPILAHLIGSMRLSSGKYRRDVAVLK